MPVVPAASFQTRRPFTHRHPHVVAAATAAALATGLLAGPGVVSMVRDPGDDGTWTLRAAPDPVPPGLALTIDREQIRGTGPCNDFSAAWSSREGIVGDGILSTAVGCPGSIGRQEDAYLDLLSAVDEVAVRDGRLVLAGPAGTLVYDRS